jgi:hypothetical protein
MRLLVIFGTLLIGIPAIREMLTSPFWGILLGLLAGVNAYLLADRKVPGYRGWIVLILFAPELAGRNAGISWSDISTGAMIVAFIALAIVFEPGEFSAYLPDQSAAPDPTSYQM